MNGLKWRLASVLALGLVILAGCDDPNQRIGMLEQENDALQQQSDNLREQLAACQQESDMCQSELLAARADANRLQNEIAALRNRPAPEPVERVPEGWTAVPGGAMIALESRVLFDSGKVKLRDQAKSSLATIARTLMTEYGDKEILVYGHTDDQPIKKSGWQDNLQLSAERAMSVVRYLREQGIPAAKMVACAAGEVRPKVPNTSAQNRELNRRVEIYALDAEIRQAGR